MSASARIFNPQGQFCSKRFFSKVKHWMEHHPIASNSILCLNLWVAGDVVAQLSEHKLLHQYEQQQQQQQQGTTAATTAVATTTSSTSTTTTTTSSIDPIRVMTSAGYGAFIYGPLLAVWYPYLDRMCKAYKIAARFGVWGAPIAKVVADELIMTPPCLFLFFGYMNVCEGGSMDTYKNKLKGEFFPSWLTSITFWPPISLATFRYLPVYAQAPVINAVCILWDAFLSHRNAIAKIKEEQANKVMTTVTTTAVTTANKEVKVTIQKVVEPVVAAQEAATTASSVVRTERPVAVHAA